MKGRVFTVFICSAVTIGVCHAGSRQDTEKLIDELSRSSAPKVDNKAAPKGYEPSNQTAKPPEMQAGRQHKKMKTPSRGVTNTQGWPSALSIMPMTGRYHYAPDAVAYEEKGAITNDAYPIQMKTQTQFFSSPARSPLLSEMMSPAPHKRYSIMERNK